MDSGTFRVPCPQLWVGMSSNSPCPPKAVGMAPRKTRGIVQLPKSIETPPAKPACPGHGFGGTIAAFMDELALPPEAASPPLPVRRWIFPVSLAGLFAIHAGLTLCIFGNAHPLSSMLSSEPVVSGRHALHLEQSVGSSPGIDGKATYDPSCYAGYPRSTVFDAEAKPARWSQFLMGQRYSPATYKIGLAVTCWLLPLGIWAATLVLRFSRPAMFAAVALGLLVSWSGSSVDLILLGDFCVPLIGVSTVLGLALLGRWHVAPSLLTWLGLTVVTGVGSALQPPLSLTVVALGLGWWAAVGARHRWSWHLALATSYALALAGSSPAWIDWMSDWWIRSPAGSSTVGNPVTGVLLTLTAEPLHHPVVWFGAGVLLIAALAGSIGRWAGGHRCPSAAAAVAAVVALSAAVIGSAKGGVNPLGPTHMLAMGLWLAILPAAQALAGPLARLVAGPGRPHVGIIVGGGLFLLVAGVLAQRPLAHDRPIWGPRPLTIGLPADADSLSELLRRETTADARILWEDFSHRSDLGWSVIFPRQLARPFIGGLDPDGLMEHSACALRDGMLAGRGLATWTAPELDGYCRRYNVGWIVCSSDWAVARLTQWPAAKELPTPDGAPGWRVFAVQRPHSYILKGHARAVEIDDRRVTLTNVAPESGEVVLSLHFQAGWRVRPAWVRIERDLDPYDPIPFVRLSMPYPAARVTLTWDAP
jgi:hypothetical protein